MFGELPKRPTERQTELHNTHMIHPLRKLLYLISRETKTQAPHVITFFLLSTSHNECLFIVSKKPHFPQGLVTNHLIPHDICIRIIGFPLKELFYVYYDNVYTRVIQSQSYYADEDRLGKYMSCSSKHFLIIVPNGGFRLAIF